MTIEEKVRKIITETGIFMSNDEATEAILALIKPMSRERLMEVTKKYYTCDNINCGKGAICNYCALKKDLNAILAEWGKE